MNQLAFVFGEGAADIMREWFPVTQLRLFNADRFDAAGKFIEGKINQALSYGAWLRFHAGLGNGGAK